MRDLPDHARTLFDEVWELAPSARAEALRQRCHDNPQLQTAVESLISAYEAAGPLLDTPFGRPSLIGEAETQPGTVCGKYRLQEMIGDGGFGQVFAAEQLEPVKRMVALKLIKPGMDTARVLARFGTEQQVLAVLEHPHIASFLDAGATDQGRPYFVMELVPGQPISEFCAANRLTIEQRVRLITTVCDAVQHAHQKGIIHRDLKPSNVLVECDNGQPTPKVIDFGVAKAIGGAVHTSHSRTQNTEAVGTPLYMSPEQAVLSRDVDTRTDVYSLGVILYELLTESPPISRASAAKLGRDQVLRMIQDVQPPLPSRRVNGSMTTQEMAARFSSTPSRLHRSLKGDLDWIVMKALHKDRRRRYASAMDLARDLRRWSAHEPVEARPPSTIYVVSRFVRRNRAACAGAALIAAMLIATTLFSVRQARLASAAELAAHEEKSRAEAVTRHLRYMLTQGLPTGSGPNVKLVDVIPHGLDNVASLNDKPRIQASLYSLYGTLLGAFGERAAAIEPLERSVALLRQLDEVSTPEGLETRASLARAYQRRNRYDIATKIAQGVIGDSTTTDASDLAPRIDAELVLCLIAVHRNNWVEAVERAERAQTLAHQQKLVNHEITAMQTLADLYVASDQHRAIDCAAAAMSLADKSFDKDSFQGFDAALALARILVQSHRPEEAIQLLVPRLAQMEGQLANNDRRLVKALSYLGKSYTDLGDEPNAIKSVERAWRIAGSEQFQHRDDAREALAVRLQALQKFRNQRPDVASLTKVLELSRKSYGREDMRTLHDQTMLASALHQAGRLTEAIPLMRTVFEIQSRCDPSGTDALRAADLLATILNEAGQAAEAERLMRGLIEEAEPALRSRLELQLARALIAQGEKDAAMQLVDQAIGEMPAKTSDVVIYLAQVGKTLEAHGHLQDAESAFRHALEESAVSLPRFAPQLKVAIGRVVSNQFASLARPLADSDRVRLVAVANMLAAAYDEVTGPGAPQQGARSPVAAAMASCLANIHGTLDQPDAAARWRDRATKQ